MKSTVNVTDYLAAYRAPQTAAKVAKSLRRKDQAAKRAANKLGLWS